MKNIVNTHYTTLNEAYDDDNREHKGIVELGRCDDAKVLGVSSESSLFPAASIALHIEMNRRLLARLKVPPVVSDRSFSMMEKLATSTLKPTRSLKKRKQYIDEDYYGPIRNRYDRLGWQLETDLNNYATHRKGVPKFRYMPECGSGDAFEVDIETIPTGGTVSYIPLFSYRLCQARSVDPEDPDKCEGWRTAVSVTEDLVGEYHYRASWQNGIHTKGIFSVAEKKKIEIRP